MKKSLGRGMMALVDELEMNEVEKKEMMRIDIDLIIPNRYQPRKEFSAEAITELAESIRECGVIQPILVSELGDGRYELIAGERRWRASREAGLKDIPAVIRDCTDEERLEIALIENIQRQDLNALEVATAYKEIIERLNINQDALAKRVGKSRSAVTNTMRLLKLPEYVRERLSVGDITEGHARTILSFENIDKMIDFTKYIIERGLSVREAENEAKIFVVSPEDGATGATAKKPVKKGGMSDLEDRIIRQLGLKVEIRGDMKKGKVQIFYHSQDELDKIYSALGKTEK